MDHDQPLRLIFDFLGVTQKIPLERMGKDGIMDRYVFEDYFFDFPSSIEALEDNLHSVFPSEKRQILEIVHLLRSETERFCSLNMLFGMSSSFDLSKFFMPLSQFLKNLGCSQQLCNVLSLSTAWLGIPPELCPLYLWSAVNVSYLLSSWRLSLNGSSMANAFSERFKELGGEIITRDEVTELMVDKQEIQGVVLKSGLRFEAPLIIAAIHPKILLKTLPKNSYKPIYGSKIESLKETRGIFSVYVAVPESDHCTRYYNIFSPSIKDGHLENVIFFQLRKSERPGWNLLTIMKGSDYENWKQWHNTYSGHRGLQYEEAKCRESDHLIQSASKIFGAMNNVRILDSFTPLTLRDWGSLPCGAAYGVLRSCNQKYKIASLHRTPVKGLHIVGQSIFAPGITGTALGSFRTLVPVVGYDRIWTAFAKNRG
jgi:phytoene dehydrogenase-like protein